MELQTWLRKLGYNPEEMVRVSRRQDHGHLRGGRRINRRQRQDLGWNTRRTHHREAEGRPVYTLCVPAGGAPPCPVPDDACSFCRTSLWEKASPTHQEASCSCSHSVELKSLLCVPSVLKPPHTAFSCLLLLYFSSSFKKLWVPRAQELVCCSYILCTKKVPLCFTV